jgi:SET domain
VYLYFELQNLQPFSFNHFNLKKLQEYSFYMDNARNYLFPKEDEIKLHLDYNNFEVKISNIHGSGLFSLSFFQKETEMGPALFHNSTKSSYKKFLAGQFNPDLKWDYAQTTATRFINHSIKPNLKLYKQDPDNGIIYAKCIMDIFPGDEITLDYKETALLAEDCSDPDVVEYYCHVLALPRKEFYAYINNGKNHLTQLLR